MRVRIEVSGQYRGAYYNAGEICNLPEDVAKHCIKRKLVAPVLDPPLTKSKVRHHETAKRDM